MESVAYDHEYWTVLFFLLLDRSMFGLLARSAYVTWQTERRASPGRFSLKENHQPLHGPASFSWAPPLRTFGAVFLKKAQFFPKQQQAPQHLAFITARL